MTALSLANTEPSTASSHIVSAPSPKLTKPMTMKQVGEEEEERSARRAHK